MRCCCIILNYNGYEETVKLLEQIKNFHFSNILVVDNCSNDFSYEKLIKLENKKIRVIRTKTNGGYGYGNNYGMRFAFDKLGSDTALICNPDVSFEEELIDKLNDVTREYPRAGIVSSLQHNKDDLEISMSAWQLPEIWNYIFSVGTILSKWNSNFYYNKDYLHSSTVIPVDCVAGSLLLITREAFEQTRGYDENIFLYCEETTLGYKMKSANFCTYCRTDVSYIHMHGISISKSFSKKVSRKKLLIKSHHYVLENYMCANKLQLFVDRIVGGVATIEELLKSMLE